MLNPTPSYTQVRRVWEPYDYNEVKQFLARVRREFGINKNRWHFRGDGTQLWGRYAIDFFFADPRDAMIFALKYLG